MADGPGGGARPGPQDRESAPAERPTGAVQASPGGPDYGDLDLRRLDPRVVQLWRILWIGRTAVLAAAVLLLGRFVDGPLLTALLVAVVALGATGAAVWPISLFRGWGYQVRETDLVIRRGVLTRTTSLVPLARIQHVDTRQDVVERRLGLARVVIFTAGIRGAELTLPGLPAREAGALRDRLARLSGTDRSGAGRAV